MAGSNLSEGGNESGSRGTMPEPIKHHMTLLLAGDELPQFPLSLSPFVQHDARRQALTIRGDVSGAPTPQILQFLAESSLKIRSPCWHFSLEGNPEHACAHVLSLSTNGDRKDLRLLNGTEDWRNPSASPARARLKPGTDAQISKSPSGPLSFAGNNLLASCSTLETLNLTASGDVRVKGQPVGWRVVHPDSHSILDPRLSFSPEDSRPYRSHLADIAKPQAPLTFGLVSDSEGWSVNLEELLYLIDLESSAQLMPSGKRVFGDIELSPVYPADSPEAEFMREVTDCANRLIVDQEFLTGA